MAVAGGDTATMVDFDKVAVAAVVPTGAKHGAVSRRVNRRSVRTGKIDTRVHCSASVERIGAHTEAACELDVHLDRLVGGDRNHAILQLVELLPAVEERLERGIGGALEWAADAFVAADAGRGNAQALQLGGGDLISNVEGLGDE